MNSNTTIKISELPFEIQKQIPLSIKLYKDEYKLDDLPVDIQNLILSNLPTQEVPANDNQFFDVLLDVDSRGDLKPVTNIKDLVLEYLRVYFQITEGYPFDPNFGNKLKRYLHKRNINVVHQLISEEVNKIVDVIRSDLGVAIDIKNARVNYVGDEVNMIIDFTVNSQAVEFEVRY